jgi:hypothetical protein
MRAVIAPDGHELGTYLRVDELAHRFDVSVDDVLAACSVLGFDAHDSSSLIEVSEFTAAVNSAPLVRRAGQPSPVAGLWRQRPLALVATGAAAAVIALMAAFVSFGNDPSGPPAGQRVALSATNAAAAYKSELKSTYESTVAALPQATDYRALAQQLAEIEPPAALRAEHAELIAEAQHVADLAGSVPDCADVPRVAAGQTASPSECVSQNLASTVDATTAADALRDHVGEVDGAPAP